MRLTSQREKEIRDFVKDMRPGSYGGIGKVVVELLDEIDRLRDDRFVGFMKAHEIDNQEQQ